MFYPSKNAVHFLRFYVVYSSNLVQLMVVNAPIFSADFDLDGDVDSDDLTVWQGAYGAGAGADADGDSDGRDFLIWQRQFGSVPLVAVGAFSVPEPGAWISLATVALICLRLNLVDCKRAS